MQLLLLLQIFLIMVTITFLGYLYTKNKKIQDQELKINQEFSKKLYRTNMKAQNMIQGAIFKSRQIYEEAKSFKKITEQETNQAVDKSFDKYLETLEENTNHIITTYENLFEEIESNIKDEETKAVSFIENSTSHIAVEIQDQVLKSLMDYKNDMSSRSDKEFEKVKQQIEEYKQARIKDLENNIADKTSSIILDVIGKNIDITDQKKIILEVLEKAKKQGAFEYGE